MAIKRDWDREIDRAVDWLWDRTIEAVDEAFPPGMLWGSSATGLKAKSTENVFKTILRMKIVDQFLGAWDGRGVHWDYTEPLKGEMLRKVGVDGRFPSPPFREALDAIGARDVIPYLKPGMSVTINPGAVVVCPDFRSQAERIEVPVSERKGDHSMRITVVCPRCSLANPVVLKTEHDPLRCVACDAAIPTSVGLMS